MIILSANAGVLAGGADGSRRGGTPCLPRFVSWLLGKSRNIFCCVEYRPIQRDKRSVKISEAVASADRISKYILKIALIPCSSGLPKHKVCRGKCAIVAEPARLAAPIVAHRAQNGVGARIGNQQEGGNPYNPLFHYLIRRCRGAGRGASSPIARNPLMAAFLIIVPLINYKV